jgi:hypothetical protein
MPMEIQIWDRHKNMARLNWLIGAQPSPLDNWIFKGIYIYKQTLKKLNRFVST